MSIRGYHRADQAGARTMTSSARRFLLCAAAQIALACAVASARAQPATTLDAFHAALSACGRIASPHPAWAGSVMTVRLILTATGHLAGPPRITYVKLAGSNEVHKGFRAAALSAIKACFPVPISGGLGGALVDRHILLTVHGSGPGEVRIPLNQR